MQEKSLKSFNDQRENSEIDNIFDEVDAHKRKENVNIIHAIKHKIRGV